MPAPTPFHDLDAYVALPRVSGLALAPDGSRLVTTVATLNPERTQYVTALWELDPTGERPARRLTRSTKGESSAVFTHDGDILFTSARPDPDGKDADKPKSALWLLPRAGGEARVVATAPGGVSGPLAARHAPIVSVAVPVLATADDLAADGSLRKQRDELKISAIVHRGYPIRHWDHDLGPDEERRFVASLTELADAPAQPVPEPDTPDADTERPRPGRLTLRQLTGRGRELFEHHADLSPDGSTLVTTWTVAHTRAGTRVALVAIDTATGTRRVLFDDPNAEAESPVISPDGKWVAFAHVTISTPHAAPVQRLAVVGIDGGEARIISDAWDRWPSPVGWLPDSSAVVAVADDIGRAPVFLVTLAEPPSGDAVAVDRVTADDAVFTDVVVAPDGKALYALRSSYTAPAEPVRIELSAFLAQPPGQRTPVAADPLQGPVPVPALPGTVDEVETRAADGVRVRGWLALPEGADADHPAPLLLWIHGGPLASWNTWSWRWNPWLMVAHGYAVLMPDPSLSTGYGQDFVQRGWGRWGDAPFEDLMAITDAAVARPDIDADRTAAMGGSFGGYMANWVAGHTDRFRAIVTHASLWALDQFGPTTDHGYFWERELTAEMALANSPHLSVGNIRTPMLVIHGDRDYRVPIGEGLRLWRELLADSALPAGDDGTTVHRFLYFPDENHWILSPQHAKVWYQVVHAFLAEHVLGRPGELPAVLG